MNGKFLIDSAPPSREGLVAVTTGVVLSLLFVLMLQAFGESPKGLVILPLLALLLLLAGNFDLSVAAIVLCLYVDVHLSLFSSAVAFSVLLAVSFVLSYRDFAWKEFANPLTAPILIYGLCIVPSFLNATQVDKSLIGLWNVAAFLIVLYTLVAGVKTHADIRRLAAVYLAVTCANGVIVVAESILGERRPFGVAGIMYVDYAALGVCLSVAMSVVSRGKPRVYLLLLAFVVTIALILTQTRNTWISSTITLAILAIYLMVRPELAGLSRRRLLAGAAIAVFVVAVIGFVVVSLNPHVQERASELAGNKARAVDQSGLTVTSLVTRYFIWDTARNAFLAHPYVGIGVYAFPYSSHQYSRLPDLLYTLYVEGNSPHQTQIAVLCETGLLGMAGYLVFMISALRVAFRTVRLAPALDVRRYGFVAAIGVTYAFVSMAFTDAWLWGQGIVLLGLLMGLMLANRKIGLQEIQTAFPGGGS